MMPKLLEQIVEVVEDLAEEEGGVLLVLAKRLLAGQRAYGRLDLAHDARDWRKERADELADALVYTAIAEVAAQVKQALAPEMAPARHTLKSDNHSSRETPT